MKKKTTVKFRSTGDLQFNMTAMIDIVFLLIIFFMLICQFIVQENYTLEVPDDCPNVVTEKPLDPGAITVSVFPNPNRQGRPSWQDGTVEPRQKSVLYAVRSVLFDPADQRYQRNPEMLIAEMTKQIVIQKQRKTMPLILLRADKNLTYADVQQALLALAGGGITKVQLAAFQSDQPD